MVVAVYNVVKKWSKRNGLGVFFFSMLFVELFVWKHGQRLLIDEVENRNRVATMRSRCRIVSMRRPVAHQGFIILPPSPKKQCSM